MADPEYELFAIRYATRDARRSDHFIGGDPHDGPMPMDYFMWVARGGGRTFVIDTGFNAEVSKKAQPNIPALPGRDARRVRHRCERGQGCDPHASALRSCRQFRPVSERALSSAGARDGICHGPLHAVSAAVAFLRGRGYLRVVRLNYARRVMFYNGDAELAPGLTVHAAGGHSAGLQFVRVRTRRGWSCSPRMSAISTRTWRASGRSPRRFISVTCWRVSKNCSRWRRTRAISCRGTIRW